VEQILAALRAAGPVRLAAALGITGLVAAALFAIMFRVGAEERGLLYSDLAPKDAAEVTAALDTASIPYTISPDGGTVYVPRSKVAEARMKLAATGLPGSGSVGYEIFDKQDVLGATSFVQNINKLRALEGEVARTIDALDTVRNARVHLVLPEKALFDTEKQDPTASVVVGLERGSLSNSQVQAIRNFVATAVPGLSVDKVTVLDERGELLAGARDGGANSQGVMDDRKAQTEERIRRNVTDIISSIVGPGAVRVQVSADMDFNQVTSQSETFDPEGSVARSTQTVEQNSTNTEKGDQTVSASNNVPDGTAANADGGNQAAENRTEETTNFEVSKTTKTEVQQTGKISKLSVAVAVDGVMTGTGATAKYAPRSPEEMERITALVKSAVGFNEERGDVIEVVNAQFSRAAGSAGSEAPSPFAFDKNDIMRGVEILALALVSLALVFFVARPLIKGLVTPAPGAASLGGGASAGAMMGLPGAGGVAALPAPEGSDGNGGRIDIARIQGSVSANSIKQVSEIVAANPDQTAGVIRGWLQRGAA
jgi:flagellar M-ring protein FliF